MASSAKNNGPKFVTENAECLKVTGSRDMACAQRENGGKLTKRSSDKKCFKEGIRISVGKHERVSVYGMALAEHGVSVTAECPNNLLKAEARRFITPLALARPNAVL